MAAVATQFQVFFTSEMRLSRARKKKVQKKKKKLARCKGDEIGKRRRRKKGGKESKGVGAHQKGEKKDESKFRTRIKEQTEKKGLVQFLGGHIAQ